MSKERILAQIRTKVGQPYPIKWSQQDIEDLYKTGAVLNVRIFAQPEGDGGVKVIVAVQTRSIVREIEIDGAERIKAEEAPQRNQSETQPAGERGTAGGSAPENYRGLSGRGFNGH